MSIPDPIFRAIGIVAIADALHLDALAGLDEDDDGQMRRANAASDLATEVWYALADATPATMGGLRALLHFYGQRYTEDEPSSMAGEQFGQLAAALRAYEPRLTLAGFADREAA